MSRDHIKIIFNNGLIIQYFDIPNESYSYTFPTTFTIIPKIVSGRYTQNSPCWMKEITISSLTINTTNYTADRHFNFIAIGK